MKNREFTREEILTSKAYVKNGASYTTPSHLLNGLFEYENDYNLTLEATHEVINENEDKTENIAFGRIHLNYNFKIDDEIRYDIGLVIGLDKGKPISKVYAGVKVVACMNLCIFGAEQLHKFEGANWMNYEIYFREEFNRIQKNIETSKRIIDGLKNVFLSHEKIQQLNGYILEQVIKHNDITGTNPILNGIKLQSEKSSRYFSEKGLNAWLYFNSLTEYLDEKIHPLDIPEKTFNLFKAIEHLLKPVDELPLNTNLLELLEDEPKKKRK